MASEELRNTRLDINGVKPGIVKATFENEDGTKRAVILIEQTDLVKDQLKWCWLEPDKDTVFREIHETYMFQAMAFVGQLLPPK